MRKVNAIITTLIFILFFVHIIVGSLALIGVYLFRQEVAWAIADIMLGLVLIHTIIGTVSVIDSARRIKRQQVSYNRENATFWMRRISGYIVLILIVAHTIIFFGKTGVDAPEILQLILSVLLVIMLIIHIFSNIKPFHISLGLSNALTKRIIIAIMIVLLAILGFVIGTFIYFFMGWGA